MTKNETPMMQQYHAIKANYQDAILFFRLGDFYEMFHEDAQLAARELEITLTARNKNADEPIPMCGVPYHSASDYIRRLVEAGYKVAICEQLEDPRSTKGMVKRDVVKVITPGTILEEQALKNKENNFLATLAKIEHRYYLFYVDISTGEARMTDSDDWMQFLSECQTIKVSEWVTDPEDESGFSETEMRALEARISAYHTFYKKTDDSHNFFELTEAGDAHLKVLEYLAAYLQSILPHRFDYFKPVDYYELSAYLQMNPYTKTQLELTESLRTKRRKGSLYWLIDRTQTAMGGRLLYQWLEKPSLKAKIIQQRHGRVERLMVDYFNRLEIISSLKQIYDLERLVTKISLQTANAREIEQLRQSLIQVAKLNQLLLQLNEGLESDLAFPLLDDFSDLIQKIDQVLVTDPPISLTEGNLIKPGYHQQLDQYRLALEKGEDWLLDYQTRERQRTGLKTLKVGYNKVFGYYIEMSRLQAAEFEDPTYVRKQTLANSERFITDELKQIESTILGAQEKGDQLEYQLFIELRQWLNEKKESLQTLAHAVAELDVLTSFSQLSEEEHFVKAELSSQAKDYQIEESRHPVLEKLIGRSEFIANDVLISPQHYLLLLTGPNMSGKSTYMRQIAYCIILNQMGCFVPAKSARLPLVDQIFTRIGSSDDLSSGQSTFMVEMIETNYALQNATESSLLLFDEIGRGTATFDGIALAEAILSYICHQVKAATIFSTHYHELTDLEDSLPWLRNIHVGAIEEAGHLVFLYKIIEGSADKSYGIHVGRLAGLPESLLAHSQRVLDELEANAKHLRHPKSQQIELFSDPNREEPSSPSEIEAQIAELDLNEITPLEALNFLADLKKRLN